MHAYAEQRGAEVQQSVQHLVALMGVRARARVCLLFVCACVGMCACVCVCVRVLVCGCAHARDGYRLAS